MTPTAKAHSGHRPQHPSIVCKNLNCNKGSVKMSLVLAISHIQCGSQFPVHIPIGIFQFGREHFHNKDDVIHPHH